jgi:acyl-CoA reductase-like NAD-dependent aldehyde dehydrogenase
MIVLADADLPRAAHAAVWSVVRAQRPGVRAHGARAGRGAVADAFLALCAEEIAKLRQGRPRCGARTTRRSTSAPSPSRRRSRAPRPHRRRASRGRARRRGRRARGRPGRFFAPTLLADATPDMAVMREETFGPSCP